MKSNITISIDSEIRAAAKELKRNNISISSVCEDAILKAINKLKTKSK